MGSAQRAQAGLQMQMLPFLRPLPDGRLIGAASFGCSSLWAKPDFDPKLAMEILDTGVSAGLNYFDTGPSYANGEGETRLGRFLGAGRKELIISTKVGSDFDERGRRTRSFAVADMERSFQKSLKRLGREYVDILYLHGPSIADLNEETFRFFENEKTRGRIIWSGVNSFDFGVLSASVETPIDALMIQYNIADLSAEPLLPKFAQRGKIVVSGTALARAVYSPATFIPSNWISTWYLLRQMKADPMFLLKGAKLSRKIRQIGGNGATVAMRFVAGNSLVHSAIFGTTKVAHMIENIRAARSPLNDAQRRLFLPLTVDSPSNHIQRQ